VTGLLTAVPVAVWLLIDALACYRATRLVTRDSVPIFRVPRDAVLDRWGDSAIGEWVTCPWCMSIWLAAPIVAARILAPQWWTPLALVLTYSAITGWLSGRE